MGWFVRTYVRENTFFKVLNFSGTTIETKIVYEKDWDVEVKVDGAVIDNFRTFSFAGRLVVVLGNFVSNTTVEITRRARFNKLNISPSSYFTFDAMQKLFDAMTDILQDLSFYKKSSFGGVSTYKLGDFSYSVNRGFNRVIILLKKVYDALIRKKKTESSDETPKRAYKLTGSGVTPANPTIAKIETHPIIQNKLSISFDEDDFNFDERAGCLRKNNLLTFIQSIKVFPEGGVELLVNNVIYNPQREGVLRVFSYFSGGLSFTCFIGDKVYTLKNSDPFGPPLKAQTLYQSSGPDREVTNQPLLKPLRISTVSIPLAIELHQPVFWEDGG